MLDPKVSSLIDQAFSEADRPNARAALESCDPAWAWNHENLMIRCQIAAIAASRGNLNTLLSVLITFETDFRDLLVGAGFAHDTEKHLTWTPDW
tara:strand:- start:678 stop:959 length:282 start_codon:yes stop_codon:yes gene_type:complete